MIITIIDPKLRERVRKAESRGRMQYRNWQLVRWHDGIWHCYGPDYPSTCIEEETLYDAIDKIDWYNDDTIGRLN